MLQGNLRLVPRLRGGAVQLAHVAHAHPRHVARTREIVVYLFVRKSQFAPYAGENGLAGDRGDRHVEPVEGHPVDLLLPLLPTPVGRRVAVGADVVVEPVAEGRHDPAARRVGKAVWQFDAAAAPRHRAVAVGGEIVVKTPADGHRTAARDIEDAFPDLMFEAVAPTRSQSGHMPEHDVRRHGADRADEHLAGAPDGIRAVGGTKRQKRGQ